MFLYSISHKFQQHDEATFHRLILGSMLELSIIFLAGLIFYFGEKHMLDNTNRYFIEGEYMTSGEASPLVIVRDLISFSKLLPALASRYIKTLSIEWDCQALDCVYSLN